MADNTFIDGDTISGYLLIRRISQTFKKAPKAHQEHEQGTLALDRES